MQVQCRCGKVFTVSSRTKALPAHYDESGYCDASGLIGVAERVEEVDFRSMSNEQIRDYCRGVCRRSTTAAEAVDRIKGWSGGYTPAIVFRSDGHGGHQFMGTIFSHNGDIVSF